MAEDIVTEPVQQPSTIDPNVALLMDMALNGPKPIEQPANQQQEPPAQGQPVVAAEPPPPVFSFDTLKDKFGYQSPEDVVKEIEELRVLKAAPPPAAEIKFENDASEKLFTAIQKGDRKEVYNILAQQERLDSLTTKEVNKDTAAEIIKLGMQLKYKDLTQAEIDYKFNKQFAVPREPVQSDTELDEDFDTRKAEWKSLVEDVEMNKMIEAKLTKPELEAAKSKLVLPEVPSSVDEGYIQYKKMLEDRPATTEEIAKAYKAFTPDDIETKMPFNDEANKVAFEYQYKPDGESFRQAVELVSDMDKFWKQFLNQDGTPDRKKFIKFVYNGLNAEKQVMEAMKQSKNATLKSKLPDNNTGGLQRQFPQNQEPNALHQQMVMAGVVK